MVLCLYLEINGICRTFDFALCSVVKFVFLVSKRKAKSKTCGNFYQKFAYPFHIKSIRIGSLSENLTDIAHILPHQKFLWIWQSISVVDDFTVIDLTLLNSISVTTLFDKILTNSTSLTVLSLSYWRINRICQVHPNHARSLFCYFSSRYCSCVC